MLERLCSLYNPLCLYCSFIVFVFQSISLRLSSHFPNKPCSVSADEINICVDYAAYCVISLRNQSPRRAQCPGNTASPNLRNVQTRSADEPQLHHTRVHGVCPSLCGKMTRLVVHLSRLCGYSAQSLSGSHKNSHPSCRCAKGNLAGHKTMQMRLQFDPRHPWPAEHQSVFVGKARDFYLQ